MYDSRDDWDGTIEGLFNGCPWGGLGNYALLDEHCDWECPFRKACLTVKKRAEQERQGEIWRRLFYLDGLSEEARSYRELLELLLPDGKCEKFPTCTHPDKDDYYCHDFCPWIPSFDDWIEELEELRRNNL